MRKPLAIALATLVSLATILPESDAAPSFRRLISTRYDALTDTLWLGFQGDPPAYRVTRVLGPRRFEVDFTDAAVPQTLKGKVKAPHSWLSRWALRAKDGGKAKLTLLLRPIQPIHLYSERIGPYVVFSLAQAKSATKPTPTVRPTPIPSPTVFPTPEPKAAPSTPPIPTPAPSPIVIAPTPPPSPTVPVLIVPAPSRAIAASVPVMPSSPRHVSSPNVSTSLNWVNETFGPESQSLAASGVLGFVVDWAPTWQDWRFPLSFGQTGYQFTNADYPGTVHRREITLGSLAVERQYGYRGLDLATGLGYAGSWAQVSSNAGAPAAPAPSRMWFSPQLDLKGFTLCQEVAYHASQMTYGLSLAWAPIENVDVSLTNAMPRLTRFRVEPSVSFGPDGLAKFSLFYDAVMGGNTQADANGVSGAFTQSTAGASLTFGLGALGWLGGTK